MKKLLAWTLSGMMLLSLTACGGGEKDPEVSSTPAAEESAAPAESAAPVESAAPAVEETAAPAESAEPEKLTQDELDPNRKVLEGLTEIIRDPARYEEHAKALAELDDLWYGEAAYEPAYAALLDYLRTAPRTELVPVPSALSLFTANPYMIEGPEWMNMEDITNVAVAIALDPNAGILTREEAMRAAVAQAGNAQVDVFENMIMELDASADPGAARLQELFPEARAEFNR